MSFGTLLPRSPRRRARSPRTAANKELPGAPRVAALGAAGGPAFLVPSWENEPHPLPPSPGRRGSVRKSGNKRFSGGQGEEARRRERKQNFAEAQSGRLGMFLTGSQRRGEAAASKQQPRMFCLGAEHPLPSCAGARPGGGGHWGEKGRGEKENRLRLAWQQPFPPRASPPKPSHRERRGTGHPAFSQRPSTPHHNYLFYFSS